jgi:gliding motility-associated-like protein
MNNEHEIDQLLKESFDNFSPEAPDVWQAVQQGVQAAQVAGTASSGVAGVAVQGAGLVTKIITGVAIAAASVTGYIVLRNQPEPKDLPVPAAIHTQPVTAEHAQPEVITPASQMPVEKNEAPVNGEKTHITAPKQSTPNQKVISQPVSTPKQEIVQPNTEMPSKPDVKTETGGNTVTDQQVVSEEVKVPVLTKENEAGKADVTKKDSAPKLPYNPNAEDGEEYEKPVIGNAFTPNNDGVNDKFEIRIENESSFLLRVWTDKGELVFESRNKAQVWDGRNYKTGTPCPSGMYIYKLNYQYKGSDKPHEKGGVVGLYL